jgi:hypothetical protein
MASRSSSTTNRTSANIAIQTLLGVMFFGIWVVVCVYIYDDGLGSVFIQYLPYFVFYELGILSRYVPGVKTFAKRLK